MSEITEIIIGYEDRLRLSDLAGQMAEAQWTVDNAVTVTMPYTITLVAITLSITILLLKSYFDDGFVLTREEERKKKIFVAISIIIVAVELILVPYLCKMFAERDILVIQAQIDEIYRIWGMSE